MKRTLLLIMIAVFSFAILTGGCGGGHDGDLISDDSGQAENIDNDTGDDTGRGVADSSITVNIDNGGAFATQAIGFWGRKRLSNGQLGDWERIRFYESPYGDHKNIEEDNDGGAGGDHSFTCSNAYVEFGCELDVALGTDWPYSGVFWTAEDSAHETPRTIDISWGGTTYNVNITIKVNGKQVFYDGDCAAHSRYGWRGINVDIYEGMAFVSERSSFYGRKVVGTNADGSKKMGPWVKLLKSEFSIYNKLIEIVGEGVSEGGYQEGFIVSRDYVEFGFEFDVKDGTNWPYSDVFWTADKGEVNSIKIKTGGGIRSASLEIKVNNANVVNESNCDSHVPHYWKTDDKIRVKTWKTGAYSNKATRFYARKSTTAKWDLLLDKTNGDHEIFIDEDYVEFGFEFDITWGTDWPYSGVFWTASKSQIEKVEDIYIEMYGTVRAANIDIYVNGNKVISDSNCSSHTRHYWRTSDNIRVSISDSGAYTTKSRNFYARKAGGSWEKKYSKDDPKNFELTPDYVAFGFEFDIKWGTDWPYSGVFWNSIDTAIEAPGNIDISVGGAVRTATITIKVNEREVYQDGNCNSHSQYSW